MKALALRLSSAIFLCPQGPHSIALLCRSTCSPHFFFSPSLCLLPIQSLHALQRPVKCAPAVQAVGTVCHATTFAQVSHTWCWTLWALWTKHALKQPLCLTTTRTGWHTNLELLRGSVAKPSKIHINKIQFNFLVYQMVSVAYGQTHITQILAIKPLSPKSHIIVAATWKTNQQKHISVPLLLPVSFLLQHTNPDP